MRLHKPRKNFINPNLDHHQNTYKPPLPKPHLSHQITMTRDASQTQKNAEKHVKFWEDQGDESGSEGDKGLKSRYSGGKKKGSSKGRVQRDDGTT